VNILLFFGLAMLSYSWQAATSKRAFAFGTNLKVTPHVAQNLERPGGSAIDARTTQHPGYAISQRKRKRIEECFGWLKTIALMRKVRHRGIFKVGWVFTFAATAYNLVRMRNLAMQTTTGMRVEVPDPRTIERELAEYEAADFIAVPTEFVARTFVERGIPRERLIVNPYGVDLRLFRPVEPAHIGGGLRVIHVGRVSVRKGVHHLIEAVGRLPQATLTVVGAPDPGMSKLLSAAHVNFIGPVPGRARSALC
jgi:hypothetical protein